MWERRVEDNRGKERRESRGMLSPPLFGCFKIKLGIDIPPLYFDVLKFMTGNAVII